VRRLPRLAGLTLLGFAAWMATADGSQAQKSMAGEVVTVSINAAAGGVYVPSTAIGINTAVWDGNLLDKPIPTLLRQAGVRILRYPGGSTSDAYHWSSHSLSAAAPGDVAGNTGFDSVMKDVVLPTGAQMMVTVNYGSAAKGKKPGTPAEAAAWVRHANRVRKYGVKYWEIGNEIYGNGYYGAQWETDFHTDHSPSAYARNAVQFIRTMKRQDPHIKVGLVLATPTQWPDGQGPEDWNSTVLKSGCGAADFVSLHFYPQQPGDESDAGLLASTDNIPTMVQKTQALLRAQCGAHAGRVGIMVTETNSVSSNPGKQTTGPVNAVYLIANYLAWLQAGVQNVSWWDLHNSATAGNDSSSLAGSHHFGDYGLLSSGSPGFARDAPYPTYEALRLVGMAAKPGSHFVQVSSSSGGIKTFALRGSTGQMALVLLNTGAGRVKVTTSTTSANGVARISSFDANHPKLTTRTVRFSGPLSLAMGPYGAALSVISKT